MFQGIPFTFYSLLNYLSHTPRCFKPIFHCKLGLRWVTWDEMSTNNMKCTWPTRNVCVGAPTQPIFHWLVLGFCVGGNANFMFPVGGNANFSVFRYQHVGNQCKTLALGVLPNATAQRKYFHVTVEYRL